MQTRVCEKRRSQAVRNPVQLAHQAIWHRPPNDGDLQDVIDAWPALPKSSKADILAVIRSASNPG